MTCITRFALSIALCIGTGMSAPLAVRGQVVPPALPKTPATKPSTRPTTGPHALAGNFLGSLKAGAVTLRLGLQLEPDGKGLKGVLDSIDQGAKIPIDSVTLDGDTLKFEIKLIGAGYEGKVAKDRNAIEGTWSQGGRSSRSRSSALTPPRRSSARRSRSVRTRISKRKSRSITKPPA